MGQPRDDSAHYATLEKQLLIDLIANQKSERRWKNIRFFTVIFLLLFVLGISFTISTLLCNHNSSPFFSDSEADSASYVALVHLNGLIMPDAEFSAEKVIMHLNKAFKDKNAKGVIVSINSGGGTPVQASIIHDRILSLKNRYHKKVIVVGEDMMASGAYLVATAADKIFVSPDTITGSIGVKMTSFGFVDAIKKVGVTRRIFAAGKNKVRLDWFEPLTSEDVTKIQTVLTAVHQHFIAIVKEGRKNHLKGDVNTLFSGDFWSGSEALQLGLVDGLGDLYSVMKKEFQVEHYRDYSDSSPFLGSLLSKVPVHVQVGVQQESSMNGGTILQAIS